MEKQKLIDIKIDGPLFAECDSKIMVPFSSRNNLLALTSHYVDELAEQYKKEHGLDISENEFKSFEEYVSETWRLSVDVERNFIYRLSLAVFDEIKDRKNKKK